jgi:hypothetical protein
MKTLALATILALGLLAAPLAASAQPARKVYRVGVLLYGDPRSPAASFPAFLTPFRESLRERGWVEGQNATIEVRNAMGNYERLKAMAAELVHLINSHVQISESRRHGSEFQFDGVVILSNDPARVGQEVLIGATVHGDATRLVLDLGGEAFSGLGVANHTEGTVSVINRPPR